MNAPRRIRPKTPCVDCKLPAAGLRCRGCYDKVRPRSAGRRPGLSSNRERVRRAEFLKGWRAANGPLCVGYGVPAHYAEDLTADHVVSVAQGGDEDGPLQALCRACNSRKRDGRPARPPVPGSPAAKRAARKAGSTLPATRRRASPGAWTTPRTAETAAAPAVRPAQRPAAPDEGHADPPPKEATVGGSTRKTAALASTMDTGAAATPEPPTGAGPSGRRLWSSVVERYELEEHERALLVEMVRSVDMLDQLAAIVAHDGAMVPVLPAGEKVHPAIIEARQQKIALARLSASLRLPAGDEDEGDGALRRPQRRGGARGTYGVRGVA